MFDRRLYSGTSLIKNTPLLGPYSGTVPRVIRWSERGELFLMSEVPLQGCSRRGKSSGWGLATRSVRSFSF